MVKPIQKKNGYAYFSQSMGYKAPNQTSVHRYVWSYFNGDIPKDLSVDHIDGNKLNNRLDNLQLLSPADNTKKALCKLSKEQVSEIKDLLGKYKSREIAKMFGVSEQLICDIKKGRKN